MNCEDCKKYEDCKSGSGLTWPCAAYRPKYEPSCMKCHYRHPDNGNCTAVGGFCTAVPAAHCPFIPELLARAEAAKERAEKAAAVVSELMRFAPKERITTCFGHPIERVLDLVKADRDGRCVVLPCKVGDPVWTIARGGNRHVERWVVYNVYKKDGGGWYFKLKNHMLSKSRPNEFEVCTRALCRFGKTVFLTREAAEAALKGEQNGGPQ